jgi:hypothetical protein
MAFEMPCEMIQLADSAAGRGHAKRTFPHVMGQKLADALGSEASIQEHGLHDDSVPAALVTHLL